LLRGGRTLGAEAAQLQFELQVNLRPAPSIEVHAVR
jgi:hypothetical protein